MPESALIRPFEFESVAALAGEAVCSPLLPMAKASTMLPIQLAAKMAFVAWVTVEKLPPAAKSHE